MSKELKVERGTAPVRVELPCSVARGEETPGMFLVKRGATIVKVFFDKFKADLYANAENSKLKAKHKQLGLPF